MNRRSACAKGGFTLIELLVVVGIIAVLITILFGALAAARSSAMGIRCASNLHQIAIATSQYLLDSKNKLPNNSYSLRDNPATLSPPPPAGTQGAATASYQGEFSTSNYQWFDALASSLGWVGGRTVAARYGEGEQNDFRKQTQYLWCPAVDQDARDPGVFATNYGISVTISNTFKFQVQPIPSYADAYCFDFLCYGQVPHAAEVVFLSECGFWNYNSEPYNTTNGSMANLSNMNALIKMQPKVKHQGLNYLFFDGHVSRERKPPHSMGGEVGTFQTTDGDQYSITSADDFEFRQTLAN